MRLLRPSWTMKVGFEMAKIVVGIDGSPGAKKALAWAATEARLRGASLHVVHAWMVPLIDAIPEPWVLGSPQVGPSDEEVYAHLAAAAKAVLDEALDEVRAEHRGLELDGELSEARAAAALIAAAGGADLLVVGSRGRGGFKGLLLGSVSAQCVHHAPCPVVVVPGSD
jgi:nucleotide-binding universal stress UspA family protein